MKKLWTIILISLIGSSLTITPKEKNKKSWQFDSNKYLDKPKTNIELLLLVDNILDRVDEDVFDTTKHHGNYKLQTNTAIKKAKQNIVHLKKIKQHLKNLEETQDDMQTETRKEIKEYKQTKQNLIHSAQHDIDSLIKIEHHLIKLEEDNTDDHKKEKESHRKHKHSIIQRIKEKTDHLLRIERKLVELTRKNPKEHKIAERIYYEAEYLKGPEIHDRETFSIEDAQYHDHLHKDISKYRADFHEKIKNYLWSNT